MGYTFWTLVNLLQNKSVEVCLRIQIRKSGKTGIFTDVSIVAMLRVKTVIP